MILVRKLKSHGNVEQAEDGVGDRLQTSRDRRRAEHLARKDDKEKADENRHLEIVGMVRAVRAEIKETRDHVDRAAKHSGEREGRAPSSLTM